MNFVVYKVHLQPIRNLCMQKVFGGVKQSQVRKQRCGECPGCTATECGLCKFCLNMKKFGGAGTLKQPCVQRKCSGEAFSSRFITCLISEVNHPPFLFSPTMFDLIYNFTYYVMTPPPYFPANLSHYDKVVWSHLRDQRVKV